METWILTKRKTNKLNAVVVEFLRSTEGEKKKG
jgi:hypothetical protein